MADKKTAVELIRSDTDLDYLEVRVRISRYALASVNIDSYDKALLRECEGDDATVSDKLLALEHLVHRMEQQGLA